MDRNLLFSRICLVHAALDGKLDGVETWEDPFFGLCVPVHVPNVPDEVLNPRNTWKDQDAYDQTARQLAGMFRENFAQSLTLVSMSDTLSGSSTLQYYAADFLGKWAVYEVPGRGPAGWLSMEANVQLGLSPASRTQSPQGNLGMVVNPQANVSGPNGLWMSELAWQQSFLGAEWAENGRSVSQSSRPSSAE